MTPIVLDAATPPAVAPRAAAALLWLAACGPVLGALAPPATAQEIVSHPDQLQFPSYTYVPPQAAKYRVKLGNGMIAYLVPDRTTPLVTVHVLMRMGPQLDPPGKEGLSAMCANLLTRSGTATMPAEQVETKVASLGAQLESNVGGGGGGFFGLGGVPIGPSEGRATVNLLSKDLDQGLALLTGCLKGAAFQADRVKLYNCLLYTSPSPRDS